MGKFSTKPVIIGVMVAGLIAGCSSDDDDDGAVIIIDAGTVDGLATLPSARPVDEAINSLRDSLAQNTAILILPVVDHQANASSAELDLRPTSVQLFGNPALGTPLMQVNQMAGLDLPQKMLAWEDEAGDTNLAYNSAEYLRQRHALDGNDAADSALSTIAGVLSAQAINASGNMDDGPAPDIDTSVTRPGEGIVSVVSTMDAVTTYDTLIAAIEASDALSVVAEVDHSANAQSIDEDLNFTRLVIFGNPNAGTPLLQAEQTVGIDLPQKMLVFADADSVVTVAYNDPAYLADRHGITGQDDRLDAISAALASLANNAAGVTEP